MKDFVKKNIKYFFIISVILALKEWLDLFRGDELDLFKLVFNTALALYFYGLSSGNLKMRE